MKKENFRWYLYFILFWDIVSKAVWYLRLQIKIKKIPEKEVTYLYIVIPKPSRIIVTKDTFTKKVISDNPGNVTYTFFHGNIAKRMSNVAFHKKRLERGKKLIINDFTSASENVNPSSYLSGTRVIRTQLEGLKPFMHKYDWDPKVLDLIVPDTLEENIVESEPVYKKTIRKRIENFKEGWKLTLRYFKERKKKKKEDPTWLYRNVKVS